MAKSFSSQKIQGSAVMSLQLIDKNMPISDIINSFPSFSTQISSYLSGFGLHCVGCHANTLETLDQGMKSHGFDDTEINFVVEELNRIVSPSSQPPSSSTPVSLTQNAADRILFLQNQQSGKLLKVGATSGGCAGYSYSMEWVLQPDDQDILIEDKGVRFCVDGASIDLLDGTQIDYTSSLMESKFSFQHNNATGSCGCGTSFSR